MLSRYGGLKRQFRRKDPLTFIIGHFTFTIWALRRWRALEQITFRKARQDAKS